MQTAFDWIAASHDPHERRKAMPYAALSALATSERSEEVIRATTSGYVTARSIAWVRAQDRARAIDLFSFAVANGFIDC